MVAYGLGAALLDFQLQKAGRDLRLELRPALFPSPWSLVPILIDVC